MFYFLWEARLTQLLFLLQWEHATGPRLGLADSEEYVKVPLNPLQSGFRVFVKNRCLSLLLLILMAIKP